MPNQVLEAVATAPASPHTREHAEPQLAVVTGELAALRFSVILTAKWVLSEAESAERSAELRNELVQLRRLYDDKIDQIAMTFGVQRAVKAKEEVERTVTLSRSIKSRTAPHEDE
jgi:hypothetical protein